MIDLHCHILPGIDDGAADVGDAVAMGRQADRDGIEAICATPHIRHDHDVRIGEIADRVATLNAALAESGVNARVLTGGEVAETAVDGLDHAELEAVGLGGGGWILLEPAPGPLSASLDATVAALGAAGFHCLIAHPERHLGGDYEARLRALVSAGALIQATAAYFAAEPTRRTMGGLARRGLVHVLGSDSHSSLRGRPVQLSVAVEALRAIEVMRPHVDWICREAPAALVAGEVPVPPFGS